MTEQNHLISYHKITFKIIEKIENALDSTDKIETLSKIKEFNCNVQKIIDKHFEQEEKFVFQKLFKESCYKETPAAEMLSEHKIIIKYHDLLNDLIYKYEKNPTTLGYESIIALTRKLKDELKHNTIFEETVLFKFVGLTKTKKSA